MLDYRTINTQYENLDKDYRIQTRIPETQMRSRTALRMLKISTKYRWNVLKNKYIDSPIHSMKPEAKGPQYIYIHHVIK